MKAAGCQVIGIDIDPRRANLQKNLARTWSASDQASARAACASLTEGRGADCMLVTAGTKSNEPVELAGELARDRAKVVIVGLVGMDVPRHSYYMKELELKLSRSYGPGRYDPQYEEKGIDYPAGYVRWTEKRNMEAFLRLVADGGDKNRVADYAQVRRFKSVGRVRTDTGQRQQSATAASFSNTPTRIALR